MGPQTAQSFQAILESKPHPEMGYRSCLGILRLGQRYSNERVEAAAARALRLHGMAEALRAQSEQTGITELQGTLRAAGRSAVELAPEPGWQHVDSACGYLKGKGSYVTLRGPKLEGL